MPPELAMQMPIMKDVLNALRIRILQMEGFEADDIIGTVAKMADKEGIGAYIITGDKDALQLVSENTSVVITKRGITDFELYDPQKMDERYGLTPPSSLISKGSWEIPQIIYREYREWEKRPGSSCCNNLVRWKISWPIQMR